MKSIIKQKETEVRYPCLRILETESSETSGTVVLFSSPNVGTVVGGGTLYPIGKYAANWNMEMFVAFTGSVTLES